MPDTMADTFPTAAWTARPLRGARLLARALRAPSSRKWLWLRALGLVAAMRLGLWVLPLRSLQVLAARLARGRYSAPIPMQNTSAQVAAADQEPQQPQVLAASAAQAERDLSRATSRAARLVPGASCLTQALALQVLLGRRGLGSRLCIGVRKGSAGGFEAHAWVERGGRVLIGGSSEAALRESWTPLTAWDFSVPPASAKGSGSTTHA